MPFWRGRRKSWFAATDQRDIEWLNTQVYSRLSVSFWLWPIAICAWQMKVFSLGACQKMTFCFCYYSDSTITISRHWLALVFRTVIPLPLVQTITNPIISIMTYRETRHRVTMRSEMIFIHRITCRAHFHHNISGAFYFEELVKKDVTPLLTHWNYVFLALTHRYVFTVYRWVRTYLRLSCTNPSICIYGLRLALSAFSKVSRSDQREISLIWADWVEALQTVHNFMLISQNRTVVVWWHLKDSSVGRSAVVVAMPPSSPCQTWPQIPLRLDWFRCGVVWFLHVGQLKGRINALQYHMYVWATQVATWDRPHRKQDETPSCLWIRPDWTGGVCLNHLRWCWTTGMTLSTVLWPCTIEWNWCELWT